MPDTPPPAIEPVKRFVRYPKPSAPVEQKNIEPIKSESNAGAPRKLGKAEKDKIYTVLLMCGSLKDAAKLIGVDPRTIRNERDRDPIFSSGVDKAEAKGKIRLIKKIGKAPQWQAAAWMLERKYGREFGRRDRYEHTGIPEQQPAPSEITVKHEHSFDFTALAASYEQYARGRAIEDLRAERNGIAADNGN